MLLCVFEKFISSELPEGLFLLHTQVFPKVQTCFSYRLQLPAGRKDLHPTNNRLWRKPSRKSTQGFQSNIRKARVCSPQGLEHSVGVRQHCAFHCSLVYIVNGLSCKEVKSIYILLLLLYCNVAFRFFYI